MVQSDATIPAENLSTLVNNINQSTKEAIITGHLTNHAEKIAISVYVLGDERRQEFSQTDPTNRIILEEAKKHNGTAYTLGMYFTDEAEQLLGKDKLLKIYEFKKQVDPDKIMNPGKVFPPSLDKDTSITTYSQMIESAEMVGKPAEEAIVQKEAFKNTLFAEEAEWDAFACDNCGYCRTECPLFEAIGWESASARGKYHFLREYLRGTAKFDERMAEMFFVCTNCQKCSDICQVKAHIEDDWTLAVRPTLLQEGFQPPLIFQRGGFNIMSHHNPGGYPQKKRTTWITRDLKFNETGEVGYWVGCASSFSYKIRNIPINAMRILNKGGIEPAYLGPDEWCCGGSLFSLGCIEELLKIARHNINAINQRGIKTLIVSCAGGWKNLTLYYPLFAEKLNLEYNVKIRHITEVIAELIEEGKIKCEKPVELKVTYHDPCQIGPGGGIYDPPRKIMASIPGLELIEMPRNREHTACCGKHTMRYPHIGLPINSSRVTEAKKTGASAIVTTCTTCENNFRTGIAETGSELEVLDLLDVVAESIGCPRLSVSKIGKLMHAAKKQQEG